MPTAGGHGTSPRFVSLRHAFAFLIPITYVRLIRAASVAVGVVAAFGLRADGQVPANQSPSIATPADPASSHFTTPAGILLVTIKPTALADYELTIRTLQEALSKDKDAARVEAAKGWRVYRAAENDAKGNLVFVHVMVPAVVNFDYRPSLLLDELVKELAPDLLAKYQDAFAAAPTKLSLTEFAQMSVAPVEKKTGDQEKKKQEIRR